MLYLSSDPTQSSGDQHISISISFTALCPDVRRVSRHTALYSRNEMQVSSRVWEYLTSTSVSHPAPSVIKLTCLSGVHHLEEIALAGLEPPAVNQIEVVIAFSLFILFR